MIMAKREQNEQQRVRPGTPAYRSVVWRSIEPVEADVTSRTSVTFRAIVATVFVARR